MRLLANTASILTPKGSFDDVAGVDL